MIGYIKGKVLSISDNTVLMENNGIGYEISCSASAVDMLKSKGEGELFTYLAVREDGLYLYGFISIEEKNMFLQLISVSGVGPKMGIGILSGMEIGDLAVKIATSDIKGLSQIKGLGKKTAERIIVELREKVTAVEGSTPIKEKKEEEKISEENEDAVIALMSLGFTRSECIPAVKKAEENGAKTIQEVVSFALKNIR